MAFCVIAPVQVHAPVLTSWKHTSLSASHGVSHTSPAGVTRPVRNMKRIYATSGVVPAMQHGHENACPGDEDDVDALDVDRDELDWLDVLDSDRLLDVLCDEVLDRDEQDDELDELDELD